MHGKNTRVYCNGYNLTSYLNSVNVPMNVDTAEVSTFGCESKKFIAGLTTANIEAEGLYEGTLNSVDTLLSNAIATNTVWTYFHNTDAVGTLGKAIEGYETEYKISGTIDDAVKIMVKADSNVGADLVTSLMPLTTVVTGSTTVLDNLVATTNGGAVYAHNFNTASATITVEHSSNNSTWSTLSSFTLTGKTSQRVAVTGTINRYVRVTYSSTGTDIQVSLARK